MAGRRGNNNILDWNFSSDGKDVTITLSTTNSQQQQKQDKNDNYDGNSTKQQEISQDNNDKEQSTTTNSSATTTTTKQIPDSVLQYERQLRKVQAEQRASKLLTVTEHLNIIYEDDYLIVCNKPSGILAVPGIKQKHSLLDLVYYEHCGFGKNKKKQNKQHTETKDNEEPTSPAAAAEAASMTDDNNNSHHSSKKQKKDDKITTTYTNDNANDDTGTQMMITDPSLMIVHRLDMDTSGLIVFAKTIPVLKTLQADFRDRKVYKEYQALVCGHLLGVHGSASTTSTHEVLPQQLFVESGNIHLPLQRDHKHPPFMRIATPTSEIDATNAVKDLQTHGYKKLIKKRPKPSHTEFRILNYEYYYHNHKNEDKTMKIDGSISQSETSTSKEQQQEENPLRKVTRLSLIPHTGRTHQLRVHCASLGHPILSDPAYGIYGEANPYGGLQEEYDYGQDSNGDDVRRGASLENQLELNTIRPTHVFPMCLHAKTLSLRHPVTGENVTWEAPVPF